MDPSAPRELYLRTVSDVRAGVDMVRAPSLAPPAEPTPLFPVAAARAILARRDATSPASAGAGDVTTS